MIITLLTTQNKIILSIKPNYNIHSREHHNISGSEDKVISAKIIIKQRNNNTRHPTSAAIKRIKIIYNKRISVR